MSQATYIVPDSDGTTFLANVNAALAAIQTGNVGTVDPSYKAAGMGWWRSDVPGAGVWTYYLYDGTSKAAFLTFDTGTHALGLASAVMDGLLGSRKGMLPKRGASAWAGLAVGTALYGLYVNAAGDDLEYRRNGWEKIADDAAPSGASTVDFTGIASGVKHLQVRFNLKPATNAVGLRLRMSQAASFVTSANYHTAQTYVEAQGGASGVGSAVSQTSGLIAGVNISSAGDGIRGHLEIPDIQNTDNKVCFFKTIHVNTGTGNYISYQGAFVMNVAAALDGLRFFFDSGNISSGRISLLGMRS